MTTAVLCLGLCALGPCAAAVWVALREARERLSTPERAALALTTTKGVALLGTALAFLD